MCEDVLYLESVFLLQLEILLPECVDTVNHDLDELYLGVSEPVFVGDVVGAAVEATGLSTGSTRLDSKLLTPLLEGRESLLGVAGEVNHDGGPHSCAQVGGAGACCPASWNPWRVRWLRRLHLRHLQQTQARILRGTAVISQLPAIFIPSL